RVWKLMPLFSFSRTLSVIWKVLSRFCRVSVEVLCLRQGSHWRRLSPTVVPPLLKSLKASRLRLAFFVLDRSRREKRLAIAPEKHYRTSSGVMGRNTHYGIQFRTLFVHERRFPVMKTLPLAIKTAIGAASSGTYPGGR